MGVNDLRPFLLHNAPQPGHNSWIRGRRMVQVLPVLIERRQGEAPTGKTAMHPDSVVHLERWSCSVFGGRYSDIVPAVRKLPRKHLDVMLDPANVRRIEVRDQQNAHAAPPSNRLAEPVVFPPSHAARFAENGARAVLLGNAWEPLRPLQGISSLFLT